MVPIKKSLAELAEVAAQLNSESDAVNETIRAVEEGIAKAAPGVNVWLGRPLLVEEYGVEDERREILVPWLSFWVVGYGREGHSEKWGILARPWNAPKGEDQYDCSFHYHERAYPTNDPRMLLSCTRELRIAATSHLEDLVEAVTSEARSNLAALRSARARIAEEEGDIE